MDSSLSYKGDKIRKKVALKPGCSLMSWVNLCNSGKDLAGTQGQILNVSPETLKLHNTPSDAWLAINGIVYNVTEYFPFHPGGEDELMKAVGSDATKLFNQVHSWVNYQSLLRCCVVGQLTRSLSLSPPPSSNKQIISNDKPKTERFSPPLPVRFKNIVSISNANNYVVRKVDWYQQMNSLCIVFYVAMNPFSVYVHLIDDDELSVIVNDENMKLKLKNDVKWPCEIKMKSKNVEIHFIKVRPSLWANFSPSCSYDSEPSILTIFDRMIVLLNVKLTHDTRLIALKYSDNTINYIPIGSHVLLKLMMNDADIEKPYTPVPLIFDEENKTIGFSRLPFSPTVLYFIIKSYPNGILSKQLCSCGSNNDTIYMSRPIDAFSMTLLKYRTKLILLAAGTGISPLLSIMMWTLLKTELLVELVLFNKTEADMILDKEITSLSEENSRLTVTKKISMVVTSELLHLVVPLYSCLKLVCISGPTKFNEICVQTLKEMAYPESEYYCFK